MNDYIVVGLGLAGLAFCELLEQHGKSFQVFDHGGQSASRVAGGLYNPVVLKRLKSAWQAHQQLPEVVPFYSGLERKLQSHFHDSVPVYRRFASAEEQNIWFEAADTPALRPFLSIERHRNDNPALKADFGFGLVKGTGRINTVKLLDAYSAYLENKGQLTKQQFDCNQLVIGRDHVAYGGKKSRNIVFATGIGMRQNPFFSYLPLQGTKGEYIEIHSPELREERLIKASVFLMTLGADYYSVGATYNWKDHSQDPTEKAADYLREKLEGILKCWYKVTGQRAGIRPTVPDRRPLAGRHPEHRMLYTLNGLGSRGVMIAPWAASQLFQYIEEGGPLDPEMDIARFSDRYVSGKTGPLLDQNG